MRPQYDHFRSSLTEFVFASASRVVSKKYRVYLRYKGKTMVDHIHIYTWHMQ